MLPQLPAPRPQDIIGKGWRGGLCGYPSEKLASHGGILGVQVTVEQGPQALSFEMWAPGLVGSPPPVHFEVGLTSNKALAGREPTFHHRSPARLLREGLSRLCLDGQPTAQDKLWSGWVRVRGRRRAGEEEEGWELVTLRPSSPGQAKSQVPGCLPRDRGAVQGS